MRRMWKENCLRIRAGLKIECERQRVELLANRAAKHKFTKRRTNADRIAMGKEIMTLKQSYPKREYVELKKKLAQKHKQSLSAINKNLYLYMKSEGMKDAS